MLRIKNLSKTYKKAKKPALKDVSFEIKEGEFVALLGPNGAGKTTLINIIAGNTKKSSGEVFVNGIDLEKEEIKTKKIIGVTPQEVSFDPFFTVNEVLKNQSGYFGIKKNQDYIDKILKDLSLFDKKNSNTRSLSGGMKRRLLIAKALVHKPKFFILDEPTAGVDIELRQNLYKFLKVLHNQGTTIVLTTHYLEEAEMLCDRILVINNGKLIADEKKESLIKKLGNNSFLEFSFEEELSALNISFLDKFSPKITDKNKIKLSVSKEDVYAVFKKFSENNIKYSSFRIEHEDLEDVFVKIIGKELGT